MTAEEIAALIKLGTEVLPGLINVVAGIATEVGKISRAYDPSAHQSALGGFATALDEFAAIFNPAPASPAKPAA